MIVLFSGDTIIVCSHFHDNNNNNNNNGGLKFKLQIKIVFN